MLYSLPNSETVSIRGIFEYDPNQRYSEGDLIVLFLDNDTPKIFYCIRNMVQQASSYIIVNNNNLVSIDENFVKPYWYTEIITSLRDYLLNENQGSLEKPISKRVLEAILQRKFATGILMAEGNVGSVDLNLVVKTGRYILYVESPTDFINFPTYFLNATSFSSNYQVAKIYGLDVFSFMQSNTGVTVQVLYGNVSNKIALCVRVRNNNIWGNWVNIKSSYNTYLLNDYLNMYNNITHSFVDALGKQSLGYAVNYTTSTSGGALILTIPTNQIKNSIMRNVSSFMVLYSLTSNNNTVYYNAIFPVPNATTNSFFVNFNGRNFQASFNSSGDLVISINPPNHTASILKVIAIV
jgi:hypothetical protein